MKRLARACVVAMLCASAPAVAQDEGGGPFSFAVMGSVVRPVDRDGAATLQAITQGPARFVVHFNVGPVSPDSCSDASAEARRSLLDASDRPVVPVAAAVEWAACGNARDASDPGDRLAHLGDVLFGGDDSLGVNRLRWSRQSALPRMGRYRENVRWQEGRVLFATFNLPDNNNNFRFGAGRNGEFDDRSIANRAWLERTFRIATERRLAGIVLFVDAAPRFAQPLRTPDPSSRDRDGYYEWKLALREHLAKFKGRVLLVQGHAMAETARDGDHPLRDATGKPVTHFTRVALADANSPERWVRIDVDIRDPRIFTVVRQRIFDDPSGELYGPAKAP